MEGMYLKQKRWILEGLFFQKDNISLKNFQFRRTEIHSKFKMALA